MRSVVQHSQLIYLDLRRAIEEYPIGRRKWLQVVKDKRIAAYRVDGKIVLKRTDIEDFITSNAVGADLDKIAKEKKLMA